MTMENPYVWPPVIPTREGYFNWNDQQLQKWIVDAVNLQGIHVRDNNKTEWHKYLPEEADALELRILCSLYGIRTPENINSAFSFSPRYTYSKDEKKHARELKKVIMKQSDSRDAVHVNVIYISTATKELGSNEFLISEEPVFVVKNNGRKYIDKNGRVYADFDDYKQNNTLSKSTMIAPQDGTYTPAQLDKEKVHLIAFESASTQLLQRIKAISDTAISIGGIVLSVTGVVTFCNPKAFSDVVMKAIKYGSYFMTAYGATGAILGINDKLLHQESIHTDVMILVSTALSLYSSKIRETAIKYAREGKTYAELMADIGKIKEKMLLAANIFSIASSSSALVSCIYGLFTKRERTWMDFYQLSMSLFMIVNVSMKLETLQTTFELEQVECLQRIQEELKSDEAKNQMKSMVENQGQTSDKKAYIIRNLIQIEDRTEFFELIKKTGSTVGFTADGLNVNDKIDISPRAYSDIGKVVLLDKLNQIKIYANGALHDGLTREFSQYVPEGRREEFEQGLKKIEKLPANDRKAALQKHINEYTSKNNRPSQEQFDEAWDKVDKKVKENIKHQIEKETKGLQQGCEKDQIAKKTKGLQQGCEKDQTAEKTKDSEQGCEKNQIDKETKGLQQGCEKDKKAADFDKLREDMFKDITGTLEPHEKKEFQEQIKKCAQHRKEYFFGSTASHRGDANYQQTMDTLEKDVADGKTLEQWKAASRDLEKDRAENKITQNKYDAEKQRIDEGSKKAEYFREMREDMDKHVHSDNDQVRKELKEKLDKSLRSNPNQQQENKNVTGDKLKQMFVIEAEANLEKARSTNDPNAIADAQKKLDVARQVQVNLQNDVVDQNRAFRDDIRSFSNGQNERLCYKIDVEQVQFKLQDIYEQSDLADITVAGQHIYAKMGINHYDRLNRVLQQYGDDAKSMMLAATNVAEDPAFKGKVTTPGDMASVTEALEKFKGEKFPEKLEAYKNALLAGEGRANDDFMAEMRERTNVSPRSDNPRDVRQANDNRERFRKAHEMLQDPERKKETMSWIQDPEAYKGEVTAEMKTVKQVYQGFQKAMEEKVGGYLMESLATKGSDDHKTFITTFNSRINAVNNLSKELRSRWSNNLTMAYHWWKHESDFTETKQPIEIGQYFKDYANSIFMQANITTTGYTQTGVARTSYMCYFGGRAHVGFVVDKNTRASHFVKDFPTVKETAANRAPAAGGNH